MSSLFSAHDVERVRVALGWQVLQLPLIEQKLMPLSQPQALYVRTLLDRLSAPVCPDRRNLVLELALVLAVIPNQSVNPFPIIRS